jgi:multidrug efflux pump subunit AcrA (membrane-fusion protein)
MTTNVEIIAAEKDQALLVPNDSVVRKKGERFATVQKADGSTEERQVEAGISDGDKTEIVSGLAEGETVLVKRGAADKWSGGNRPPGGPSPTMMLGGRR